ncbi:MAG: ATP-grasp domain-containing protein [Nitrososphaera sp.]|nr:ATP-grasp domain-containing protein [Nitrososphaera sp.]
MEARVLVTAAGSIIAQGIIKSLKLASQKGNIRYRIFAADMSLLAAGLYRCEAGALLPPASSPRYLEALSEVCERFDIQAVFCGSDDELMTLAEAKTTAERRTGAKFMVGSKKGISTARDKWKTYEFCKANNIPCAPSSLPQSREEFTRDQGYPIVVKPREGYGSAHLYIVNEAIEMEHAISVITQAGWRPVLQKYLSGESEFTSGVTVDRESKYTMSSISIRKIIKHGQTYKAFIDDYSNIRKSAEEVALKLQSPGPINIQTKIEKGNEKPLVFEINPRFSATCPMRAFAGVNEPDIVYRNTVLGEETKVGCYDRLVSMRYWNEVYVPMASYEKSVDSGPGATIKESGSLVPDYF